MAIAGITGGWGGAGMLMAGFAGGGAGLEAVGAEVVVAGGAAGAALLGADTGVGRGGWVGGGAVVVAMVTGGGGPPPPPPLGMAGPIFSFSSSGLSQQMHSMIFAHVFYSD